MSFVEKLKSTNSYDSTIIHISDLHFGRFFLPEVGNAVVRSVDELDPDLIIASGDFTQEATKPEFVAARKFLDSLPDVPLVITPGNHDVPPKWQFRDFFSPFNLYRKFLHPELNYSLETESCAVVSLNSTTWFGSLINGRIKQSQLDYCREIFSNFPPSIYRVVVLHHQLVPAPSLEREGVVRNARQAIRQLSDLNVDLVLGGHKHRSYVGNSLDFYEEHGSHHGIVLLLSGTTTSRRGRGREREKNSLNLIQINQELIEVTQYMYFPEEDNFAPFGFHSFPRKIASPADGFSPVSNQK